MYKIININEYFQNVDTLVICGGGIKGISFCQSLHTINKKTNFLKNVTNYAGASIGSFICLFLILGVDIVDIIDFMEYLLFKNVLMDSIYGKLWSLYNKFGSLDSTIFLKSLKYFIEKNEQGLFKNRYDFNLEKILDMTIEDFMKFIDNRNKDGKKRTFFVISTNLSLGYPQIFSSINTPNVTIKDCILATVAAIPIITSHKIKRCKINKNYNNELDEYMFIDGGFTINFPMNIFTNPEIVFKNILYEQNKYINNIDYEFGLNDEQMDELKKTLPVLSENYDNIYGIYSIEPIDTTISWYNILYKCLMTLMNSLFVDNKTINRTNCINAYDVPSLDFNNVKLIPKLKKYGVEMVQKYYGDDALDEDDKRILSYN